MSLLAVSLFENRESSIVRHYVSISICFKSISAFNFIEISKEVFLSPRTIETIRQNMKQKVGAKTIAGLVMYGMRNKMLE